MYTNAMDKFLTPHLTKLSSLKIVKLVALAYASGGWVYEVESYDELSLGILNETDCSSRLI